MGSLCYKQKPVSVYVSYAKRCLIEGRTHTRGFDNCFENGCGDEVVRRLMRATDLATPDNMDWADGVLSRGIVYRSPEWRKAFRIKKAARLKEAIQRIGSWDYWRYFVENGTYEGFRHQHGPEQ